MKIIKLQAENIKRISAVEITPEGNLIIIAGKNAQGKSSTLDSILFALDYRQFAKNNKHAVRLGEQEGSAHIELGDLIVDRKATADGKSYLKVSTREGAQFPSPQSVLDALIGELSFDPLEFTRLSAKDQVTNLIKAGNIKIDLEDYSNQIKALYDQRTEVNREFKKLEALRSQAELPENYETLPDKEIPATKLNDELKGAYRQIQDNNEKVKLLDDLNNSKTRIEADIQQVKNQIEDLQHKLTAKTNELHDTGLRIEKGQKVVSELPKVDIEEIESRISELETINNNIRKKTGYVFLENQAGDLKVEADQLTQQMEELNNEKAEALKNAKLPVAGLSFNDEGITFNGVAFAQCSSAEQLKVSLAIAMALNPKLRVIRIMDGSLLDKDNLKVIEEMAKDKDFQVWIERVETDDDVAVIIEDGMVKEVKTAKKPRAKKVK